MSVERFDSIARLLAQGVSRRTLLKGFGAGLSATLLSTFRLGSAPSFTNIAHAASRAETYLPLVVGAGTASTPSICAIPSLCNDVIACSTQEDCRCILSAEGDLRCGKAPACSAQSCTSSADCAGLGEGYFCDTEGSGCCGEGQRCIPPCETESSCPEELICGATCCPPNNTCVNGVCVDPVEGTWTGTLAVEGQSLGIRFVLSQRAGSLSGRMLLQDPVSQEYLESGPLKDSRYNEDFSTFFLHSGSSAFGDFTDNRYEGKFTFVGLNNEPRVEATLMLQRG
jgi:hypothetical protein